MNRTSRTFGSIILIVFVVLSISVASIAGEKPDARTHFLEVEYEKPTVANPIGMLTVTIFDKAMQAKADVVLHDQLQAIIKEFSPREDILATAWDSDDNATANQLGKGLIYSVKDHSIAPPKF